MALSHLGRGVGVGEKVSPSKSVCVSYSKVTAKEVWSPQVMLIFLVIELYVGVCVCLNLKWCVPIWYSTYNVVKGGSERLGFMVLERFIYKVWMNSGAKSLNIWQG